MNKRLLYRLLERAQLWKLPETCVVVLDGKTGLESVLLQTVFRNTIHGFYLAFTNNFMDNSTHRARPLVSPRLTHSSGHPGWQYLSSRTSDCQMLQCHCHRLPNFWWIFFFQIFTVCKYQRKVKRKI